PPWSTLFPYTTLFRSFRREGGRHAGTDVDGRDQPAGNSARKVWSASGPGAAVDRCSIPVHIAGSDDGRGHTNPGWCRLPGVGSVDRKSTRLNSSHSQI